MKAATLPRQSTASPLDLSGDAPDPVASLGTRFDRLSDAAAVLATAAAAGEDRAPAVVAAARAHTRRSALPHTADAPSTPQHSAPARSDEADAPAGRGYSVERGSHAGRASQSPRSGEAPAWGRAGGSSDARQEVPPPPPPRGASAIRQRYPELFGRLE